jgi:hypothetical protein
VDVARRRVTGVRGIPKPPALCRRLGGDCLVRPARKRLATGSPVHHRGRSVFVLARASDSFDAASEGRIERRAGGVHVCRRACGYAPYLRRFARGPSQIGCRGAAPVCGNNRPRRHPVVLRRSYVDRNGRGPLFLLFLGAAREAQPLFGRQHGLDAGAERRRCLGVRPLRHEHCAVLDARRASGCGQTRSKCTGGIYHGRWRHQYRSNSNPSINTGRLFTANRRHLSRWWGTRQALRVFRSDAHCAWCAAGVHAGAGRGVASTGRHRGTNGVL